ncbi:DNA (cytosine-5-)-methyltransferase [Altererythrobacter confluentis]|uniref:DNA (cytosine-5-)-methyltransferase n=1 Tax=Allopontixanthobacter confluentis TaxID=1849021 RepID=A0A6L7GKB2_9SPHN|nr:DNA (cytosine-5-)-methyltransferase [Allopontixanthobacter confluentis]
MRSVELFTGCGGLALGLSRAGFEHEALFEWDNDAVETVLHNKAAGIEHVEHWPVIKADVRDLHWNDFADMTLVAGGPPCQPFSIGGKHKGNADARDMWPHAVRAVAETMPRAFLFENVRGLARPKFAGYLASIVDRLRTPAKGLRYDVTVHKVNAADFGAPQQRHRVVIVGLRSDEDAASLKLEATHSRERMLWDQYVEGAYWSEHQLEPRLEGFAKRDAAAVRKLRDSGVEPQGKRWVTVRDALRGLGEPNGENNHVFQAGAKVYPGHTGSPLDLPSKALKAGDHGVPGGENMMVKDDDTVRYFTLREAARLQGLPDDYMFPRSWTESMRQLGNAVPCQLSEAVGNAIVKTLTRHDRKVPMAA